jgi:acetate---CoA ligase (ADP-forming)
VPMVACETVRDADEAVAAAERIGWPVAMKGVAPHLPHKTELGLVRLGLCDRAGIASTYRDLHAALQRHSIGDARGAVVVQSMAPPGIELILGANNWPGFGSFLLVGPGGIRVETNRQAAVRRGPVSPETARDMLNETSAATLLAGVRGQPACDLDAVANILAAFSRFAASHRNVCAAIEINPLIVTPHGALGVDLLIEPHREESPG